MKVKLTEPQRETALARVERYNAAQEAFGRSIRVKFNGEQYRIADRGRSSWCSGPQIDRYIRNLEAQLAERSAQAIEARMAETAQTGSVHESAVRQDAPGTESLDHIGHVDGMEGSRA